MIYVQIDMICGKVDEIDATMVDVNVITDAITDAVSRTGMSCGGVVKLVDIDESGNIREL